MYSRCNAVKFVALIFPTVYIMHDSNHTKVLTQYTVSCISFMQCVPSTGEKGKFSITPVSGGPAEKAGLRKGDRLVWINGALACELTHSAINKMVGTYLLI